jgi:cell division control protein 6
VIRNDDVFRGDKVKPSEMPEREEELNAIHSAIEPTARGATPQNLFLYGKPGQGKTAGVKLKSDQFLRFTDEHDIDVTITYIECTSANKSYHVLTSALKHLKDLETKPKGKTLDNLYTDLFDYMNEHGGTYIFVLDEIDRIRDSEDDDLNILYKLPRAHSSEELDDNVACSVIGISNDRRFKNELSPRIKDSLYESEVDFVPYGKEQLKSILYRRAIDGIIDTRPVRDDEGNLVGIESGVISEGVIEVCAGKAKRERGSARQAIDLLGQAATIAHDDRAAAVTLEHVETAQREVNKNYIKNMLEDHSPDDLLTLCGLMYLEVRDETPAQANEIHTYYSMYAESLDEEPLVQRRMRDRLQDLKLTGVINMQKQAGGRPGGPRWSAEVSIPMDETIEIMLNDESYAPRYGNIVKEIASEAQ